MKKFQALVLVAVASLALAACGKPDAPEAQADDAAATVSDNAVADMNAAEAAADTAAEGQNETGNPDGPKNN